MCFIYGIPMNIETYEKKFKDRTWVDLYEASLRYWLAAWLSFNTREEAETLRKLIPEWFEEWYKTLIDITLKEAKTEAKTLTNAIEYSKDRSFYICREDALTAMSKHIFNEEEIIDVLLTMWAKWLNPVILLNSWEKVTRFRSILRFRWAACKQNKFIINMMAGKSSKIRHQEIDNEILSKQTIININKDDILWLDFKVYHPIVRGKILKHDFNSLIL